MLRVDRVAFDHGTLFCQGSEDAIDVDQLLVAGDATPPIGHFRDPQVQWVRLWGPNHVTGITGPRAGGPSSSVRFRRRAQTAEIEPLDLVLDPTYYPGRDRLNVGADLSRQAITP